MLLVLICKDVGRGGGGFWGAGIWERGGEGRLRGEREKGEGERVMIGLMRGGWWLCGHKGAVA